MSRKHRFLLFSDAIINLILGVILLLSPAGTLDVLGLPSPTIYFYATILGGVIFGIGLALAVELFFFGRNIQGLGLGGAVAINLCGGSTLLYWLIFGHVDVQRRGRIVLWVVAILVLGLSLFEIGQHVGPAEHEA